MKRWIQKRVALMTKAISLSLLPVMRWCAPPDFKLPSSSTSGYVLPDGSINILLVSAAMNDQRQQQEQDPQAFQARLNACLEVVRHQTIGGPMCQMFGRLIVANYPPDESLYRVLANALLLGMDAQARLDSGGQAVAD